MVECMVGDLRTKLADPGLLTARHGMSEVQCNAARAGTPSGEPARPGPMEGRVRGRSRGRRGLLRVGCCMCEVGSVMPRAADELAPAVRCNLYDGLRYFLCL